MWNALYLFVVSLNDGHIFDIIFSDEYIMDIVGALECERLYIALKSQIFCLSLKFSYA